MLYLSFYCSFSGCNKLTFSLVKLNDEKHLKRQNVVNIFKKYDCDITGVISRQDFQLMYRDLVRQQLTKTELDSAIQLLDPTGTGYVQFNDYVLWMENVSASY